MLDVAGYNLPNFHKWSYDEQVVGLWTNNETLYEKTFKVTVPAQENPSGFLELPGKPVEIVTAQCFFNFNNSYKPSSAVDYGRGFTFRNYFYLPGNSQSRTNNSVMLAFDYTNGKYYFRTEVKGYWYYGETLYLTLRYIK